MVASLKAAGTVGFAANEAHREAAHSGIWSSKGGKGDHNEAPMRPDSTDTPRVLILPPFLFGGTLLVGLLLHWLHPISLMPVLPARILGGVLFVLSGLFGYLAQRELERAGTNVRPDRPTTAIVMEGPYRITRNPLYIALLGIYIGVAIFVNAVMPLLLLIPLFVVLHWGIVLREERYLESKFGDGYRAYRARVRRWL